MKTIFDMENYNRIVIELFKEAIINQVNRDKILEVQRVLANAITTARILEKPADEISALNADLEFLKSNIK